MTYKSLKEECFETNLMLPKLNLIISTFGNVSCVDKAKGIFGIKPSGVPYDVLKIEDIVICDFDGLVVDGNMRPSSDTKTHAVLYKSWPDIGGIAHTHSTFATAWAQSLRDIPLFGTTHADYLTQDIPCALPMKDTYIQGDYEWNTGLQIIDCLKERGLNYKDVQMMLVGSHAPFTWGENATQAVHNSAILEQCAHMAYLTLQINPHAERLKQSLIDKHHMRKHGPKSYYGQY